MFLTAAISWTMLLSAIKTVSECEASDAFLRSPNQMLQRAERGSDQRNPLPGRQGRVQQGDFRIKVKVMRSGDGPVLSILLHSGPMLKCMR